jgi:hypothetical protein
MMLIIMPLTQGISRCQEGVIHEDDNKWLVETSRQWLLSRGDNNIKSCNFKNIYKICNK